MSITFFLPPEEICTLVIAEVFAEDSGMFTCTASNKYGTVSSAAALRVKGNTSVSLYKNINSCLVFFPKSIEIADIYLFDSYQAMVATITT